jgi:hypothetical protein
MKMKNIVTTQYNRFKRMVIALLLCAACNDFIEIDPPKTEISNENVFNNDASAASAVRGIYSLMMTNPGFTRAGMEEYTGIASDELISYATRADVVQFYNNSLAATNNDVLGVFWREAYRYINNANAVLEGLSKSTGISSAMKNQLAGEAKFIRAFCHFYLVNLFDDVPYLTSTDYRMNAKAVRIPTAQIYENMEMDLLEAVSQLSEDYKFSAGERIQPNKGAAIALLARLYLYLGEWEKAETYATQVIGNPLYSLESDLNRVFLPNSAESIWQLRPVIPGSNTPQGQLFILIGAPNATSRRVSLTPHLVNAFEVDDERRAKWVGTFTNASGTWHYPYKYKVGLNPVLSEYATVLRLAEQYLIRAEARARLNDVAGAQEDLNAIRNRSDLENTSAFDQPTLLAAIEQERRVELFAEWGHRWLDIKRTNRANEILSLLKTDWQATDVLFPIPESERLLNPGLSQNDGY